jgi:hypothetical protein
MKHLARSISEICGTIALQAAHLAILYLTPEWEYPFPSRTLLRFLRPRLHVLRFLRYPLTRWDGLNVIDKDLANRRLSLSSPWWNLHATWRKLARALSTSGLRDIYEVNFVAVVELGKSIWGIPCLRQVYLCRIGQAVAQRSNEPFRSKVPACTSRSVYRLLRVHLCCSKYSLK